ncbi:MAG: hypothetical protein WC781_04850 [Candidatus Pacearchaeota archaeon]|jgi:hypothetical protein
MKFTFNINIQKKHVLSLFILFSIVGIGLVIAQTAPAIWQDNQHLVWHSASDIKVNIDGTYYSLQDAIDNNMIGRDATIPTPSGILIFSIPKGNLSTYETTCQNVNKAIWGTAYISEGEATTTIDPAGSGLNLINGGKYTISCPFSTGQVTKTITLTSDSNTEFYSYTTGHMLRDYTQCAQYCTDRTGQCCKTDNGFEGIDTYKYSFKIDSGKLKLTLDRSCSDSISASGTEYGCQFSTLFGQKSSSTCPSYKIDSKGTLGMIVQKTISPWTGVDGCIMQKIG